VFEELGGLIELFRSMTERVSALSSEKYSSIGQGSFSSVLAADGGSVLIRRGGVSGAVISTAVVFDPPGSRDPVLRFTHYPREGVVDFRVPSRSASTLRELLILEEALNHEVELRLIDGPVPHGEAFMSIVIGEDGSLRKRYVEAVLRALRSNISLVGVVKHPYSTILDGKHPDVALLRNLPQGFFYDPHGDGLEPRTFRGIPYYTVFARIGPGNVIRLDMNEAAYKLRDRILGYLKEESALGLPKLILQADFLAKRVSEAAEFVKMNLEGEVEVEVVE